MKAYLVFFYLIRARVSKSRAIRKNGEEDWRYEQEILLIR